jgi:hypothetical protein
MTTATAEVLTVDRKSLIHDIEHLPDRAILQIKGYIERIRDEGLELENIDAEIAALEARYGTTPNAETIAAMRDAEEGRVEVTTIEEIMAEFNAYRRENSRVQARP